MEKQKKICLILTLIILMSFILIKLSNNNYYITYCNYDYRCNVVYSNSSLDKIKKIYKNYAYLKVDKVIDKKKITLSYLSDIISNTSKNEFSYGIDFNNKITLFCEEINSNRIIDYNSNTIDLDKLNTYISSSGITITAEDLNNLAIFKTKAYFKENNKLIKLKLENGFHVRNYDDDSISDVILNATNRLISMEKVSGEFIYGYNANTSSEIKSYNVLRHAGSVYSLIKYYEITKNEELKQDIDNAIFYLLDNFLIKKSGRYFIEEKDSSELKLGGSALTLLMLSEYQIAFGSDKYYDTAKKIADGILYFQQDGGVYYHVLDKNLKVTDPYRTVYYDGEATFSLLRFYKISKDEKYYNAALKTIDMFIENNYLTYHDHWISYSLNEFLKYNTQDKYIKFALDNYTKNEFDSNTSFSPTRLELLVTTLDTYNYLKDNKIASKFVEEFDVRRLNNSIKIAKDNLLNYYINDEVAIYFNNPDYVKYGFTSITDDFRVRIDDIQHSILALMNYNIKNEKR